MSAKQALKYRIAAKKRNLMIEAGPLGPYSEKEWMRWLDYIPNFYQERINYLSQKTNEELKKEELVELCILRKELKMRDISKNYKNKETSSSDYLEYIHYITQNNLESLIRKKLTIEEYVIAIESFCEIVNRLSYEELRQYCKEKENNFDSLSMIDLFILREISREYLIQAGKKNGKKYSYILKRNANMRSNSEIETSKRRVL